MQISNPFNKFYHKVILIDFYNRCSVVKFYGWIDAETNKDLEWIKGENFNEMDELKQLFKNMNLTYPLGDDKKASTTDISPKDLVYHIEWVFRVAAYNHIEMEIVEREWRELLQNN